MIEKVTMLAVVLLLLGGLAAIVLAFLDWVWQVVT